MSRDSGVPSDDGDHRADGVGVRHHYSAIDGLRAVAILLVVLNHAEVRGFERGFIGVDMFFAISGFLITDRIVVSLASGETQPLGRFWAGRARRIFPALVVVITATCVASALLLSPQELQRVAGYGLAADLFSVNNLIAYKGGNYFAGPLRELPFLHLWSLAVEEQFYIVWPIALGAVARFIARVTRRSYRRVIAVGLGVCIPASVVVSVVLTPRAERWAFYALPTRVYEFALGGAVVLFWSRITNVRWVVRISGLVGCVCVGVGLAITPVGNDFPSAWPLLAAGGTVLIILGAEPRGRISGAPVARRSLLSRALGSRPASVVGRYSYGWYLWHWPVLVLGTAAWGAGSARVASVFAIIPAILSFHFVEQPVRYWPALVRSTWRSIAFGGAVLAVGALACIALAGFGRSRLDDPRIAQFSAAEESFAPAGCTMDSVTLSEDVCIGGSSDPADPIVLLVGDSHAGQWVAAFSEAGRSRHFRVAMRSFGNCSGFEFATADSDQPPDCWSYQRATRAMYEDPRISAVVVSEALTSRRFHGGPRKWYEAAERAVTATGPPMGLVVDNPASGDPLRCLSRGKSVADCSISRAKAFADLDPYRRWEALLASRHHVSLLDLTDIECSADPCPLKYQGIWIAARANHLTRDFTLSQERHVGEFVDGLLGRVSG